MKAHRTDLVSFAFGLVFLALALWWLLARILGLTLPPVGWFLAGALIVVGLLGLVGALRSGRHPEREAADQQPEATVAAPYVDGTPTSGGPVAREADEWATDAVSDDLVAAREDRPFGSEPVTRELPVADPPERPAGDRRTDGDEPGPGERPPG